MVYDEITERANSISSTLIKRAAEINNTRDEKIKLLAKVSRDLITYISSSYEGSQKSLFILDLIEHLENLLETP